jgi:2'-5' RNA ligase
MQNELPGFEPAHAVHNLFFALSPAPATRAAIAAAADALRAADAPAGRWLKPPRYHLTLQFLGEYAHVPADLVARAIEAAGQVTLAPFSFALDVVGSFGARRMPLWLGCSEVPPELLRLHEALGKALARHACRTHGATRLVPHVTILRDAERALHRRLPLPIAWHVDEFVLIDSQPPEPYRVVGRWPLQAGQET